MQSLITPQDEAELKQLETQFRDGNRDGLARWCEILKPMSLAMAKRSLRRKTAYPGNAEDMASEGIATAIRIANRLVAGKLDELIEPAHYVTASMKQRMGRLIKGKKDSKPSVHLGQNDTRVEGACDDFEMESKRAELVEDILPICRTDFERRLIEALSREPDPYITAAELKCQIRLVIDTRQRIFDRYEARCSARGDDPSKFGRKARMPRHVKPQEWKVDKIVSSTNVQTDSTKLARTRMTVTV